MTNRVAATGNKKTKPKIKKENKIYFQKKKKNKINMKIIKNRQHRIQNSGIRAVKLQQR